MQKMMTIRGSSRWGMRGLRALPGALLVVALLVAGCQGAEQSGGEAEEPAQRVENPAIGVAIANLPAFFDVAVNEGDQLGLTPADPAIEGRLMVVAGDPPEVGGVNLVAAVQAHKEDVLARPDGEYQGQRELAGLPLGTSFYSRGRYTAEDGRTEEEIVMYFLHPRGDRPLMLVYRYPAGDDTPIRLQEQLFEVALELEPLDASADSAAEPGADETTSGEGAEGGPSEEETSGDG